jgi:hypothetical protein
MQKLHKWLDWGRQEIYIEFCCGNLLENVHFEDGEGDGL